MCLSCGSLFENRIWRCPNCLWEPEYAGGFALLGVNHADRPDQEGFMPEYFRELEILESGHFWFTARNRLIRWAVSRYFPLARSFLDLGCGTGDLLAEIEMYRPRIIPYGADFYVEALIVASRKLKRSELFQADIRTIPFRNEFDLIGLFDVLEHIDEDEAVLREANKALAPGGGILVTVPQHPALWSCQDEYGCHLRRYRAHEIRSKLKKTGFRIIFETSFVSLLLPAMALNRLFNGLKKKKKCDPMAELKIPSILNRVFARIMFMELLLIERGISFPAGGSLIFAAVKDDALGKSPAAVTPAKAGVQNILK
ncbi:MAG: class I SAM-dependent methyltransferase [Desulfobacteraceae bacterium]|nr:MAG: class I SAM-dependent methyltransferase [Desulfobacteraceae bacterium]